MKYPPVADYGGFNPESFDAYYARWPNELASIPKQVVEDWIHRHWRDFASHWVKLSPHAWAYELKTLTSEEVLTIDHIGTWIAELDAEGVEYVSGARRSQTRLATFMLDRGTFPVPILVAKMSGHVVHPRSRDERMKEPLQLIEGHARLACLRGMINSAHPRLASKHQVWVASIPLR
jgi:hypothetical protein